MVDPFSSIGVAASIVQLVQFGADLVSDAKNIRQNGLLADIESLQTVAKDLSTLTKGLQINLLTNRAQIRT